METWCSRKLMLTSKWLGKVYRRSSSHKGDNGRILIVGGSDDYVGCLALAGSAAFASGADLVTIAAPEKVAWAINKLNPDFITIKLSGSFLKSSHFERIKSLSVKADVLLFGNGAGTRKPTAVLFHKLAKLQVRKVIDADALKVIKLKGLHNAILTPHSRELEIFMTNNGLKPGNNPKSNAHLLQASGLLGDNVLLLKGKTDVIILGDKLMENKTGNSGMTKAGTGDVLAGIAAAFSCQEPLFRAACRAAYVNGSAGDLLLKGSGYGFTASNLVDALPSAMRQFWRAR